MKPSLTLLHTAITVLLLSAVTSLSGCAPTSAARSPVAYRDGPSGDMVYLQGGTFLMGSDQGEPDERPLHTVTLSPFYIDACEVTVREYEMFLKATKHRTPAFWHPELDRPDDPVIGVTWHDAASYAAWAGKRLPTEAEWEFAARGGDHSAVFPWGNDADTRRANFRSSGIAPVKRFAPNPYGVYDMSGNVWEWCADWYDENFYRVSPADNPKGPFTGTYKLLRGGAWYSNEDQVRITNRYYALPDSRSFHTGFRCAKSAPMPER